MAHLLANIAHILIDNTEYSLACHFAALKEMRFLLKLIKTQLNNECAVTITLGAQS